MKRTFQHVVNYRYFHVFCFSFLFVLWTPMAFFGFHPFHEGFMLAILNLTPDAIKSGNTLPFNQYGPFWVLPYLSMDLLQLGGFTFLAQRFLSLLIIFLSAIVVRRISLEFYSRNISLLISCLFLVTYPFGQPSIIWPSIPAQLALLLLTYTLIRTLDRSKQIDVFIAATSTFFLLGSRIQIGILSFLCTIVVLSITKKFTFLAQYLVYLTLFLASFVIFFRKLGFLGDVFFDSVLFPFTYLDPNVGALTIPRTSIAVGISLFLIYLRLKQTKPTEKLFRFIQLAFFVLLSMLILVLFLSQSTYLKIYARIYVGIFLTIVMTVLLFLFQFIDNFGRHFALKKLVLYSYSLVGSVQIFPLFDVFHAWYASAPLIIALPLILRESCSKSISSRNRVVIHLSSLVLAIGTLFGIQALKSFSNEMVSFPLDEVRGVYLSAEQANDLEKQYIFFKSYIPREARVLNICSHADPFFPDNYWSSESRFFLFWPAFSRFNLLERELMKAEYVTTCAEISDFSARGQSILQKNFSRVETGQEVISWGRKWQIYIKN